MHSTWHLERRLLCVRLDTAGDVLMTTPALTALKEAVLAAEQYDAAVVFTVYSRSPLPAADLVYLAGVPRCLGRCRENPYHLLAAPTGAAFGAPLIAALAAGVWLMLTIRFAVFWRCVGAAPFRVVLQ